MVTQSKLSFNRETLTVVYYLISQLNGVLGKTHLQKLLFLSDLISVSKYKEQISSFEYKKYKHGPFSSAVDIYTKKLIDENYIETRKFSFVSDPKKNYVRYYDKKMIPTKEILIRKIGPDKVIVLDEVINSFGSMSLQKLLDIVYNLQIIRNSKMDQKLPLDIAEDIVEEPEQKNDLFDVV